MKKCFNSKFQCVTYEIFAGEIHAVADANTVLVTLLGSCVAVCLIDEINRVCGMNHFMLPGKLRGDKVIRLNDPKYGICAIDMLMRDMVKIGADRKNFKAKVFGAGRMTEQFSVDIAQANADFIKRYLSALKIPIVAEDLGGKCARKLYFFTDTHEVFLKRITEGKEVSLSLSKEKSLLEMAKYL